MSKPSLRFWILGAFLLIVFFTGGSSRTDIQSLLVLRPVSVAACALALMTLHREHFQGRKWLFGGFFAMVMLAAIHVLPLPPAWWQALPGRNEVSEIDTLAGLSGTWRPITLTPMNGWHALVALFTPLAIVLFGIQLNRNDLYRLLPLLIGLSALSGLLGLLQVIGSPEGPLYFYRVTNNGSAVGLFANRNHAATLLACLFPMLAVFASTAKGTTDEQKSRQLIAAAIGIVLVPLILVTGSRSGIAVAVLGLLGAALLYRRPAAGRVVRKGDKAKTLGPVQLLGGLAVIAVGFLTFFFSRAEAIERLFADTGGEQGRSEFWLISLDMFWKYFPWGSGSGSFAEAFQIVEPDYLLDPTFLNRAHNDWIEIGVTFGIPGLLLLAIAILFYLRRTFMLWFKMDGDRRSVMFARLSATIMALMAIASIADYPLRMPTMMCVFAILSLWFVEAGREPATSTRPADARG